MFPSADGSTTGGALRSPMSRRVRIATTSLAGCFGCHTSLLDMDERLLRLAGQVELDRSPFTDRKQIRHCDIGLIEGGLCNSENIELLRRFRACCTTLVALGACAVNGGVPALRNRYTLEECLREAYLEGAGIENPQIPNDPELPRLLENIHPIHELVTVDYSLPGCPPPTDAIWALLQDLIAGREPVPPPELIRYD